MKWSEMTEEQRDRFIHAKVMGISKCLGNTVVAVARGWQCTACSAWGLGKMPGEHEATYETIPKYSTDMNDAWSVVKEMNKSDALAKGYTGIGYARYHRFVEELEKLSGSGSLLEMLDLNKAGGYLPLGPDSIGIASLRACGVEIEP